jgi:hypothetical protein
MVRIWKLKRNGLPVKFANLEAKKMNALDHLLKYYATMVLLSKAFQKST